ncbi:MAG: FAD-binding oxidoreductase [Polyangiaceae bacterium]|nr:FAD-binding oxidoreductase [Polyangiaceae bacterium]
MQVRKAPYWYEVVSWDGSVVSHPVEVVTPKTVEDIVAVMKDKKRYPSPVRAVGSNHSATTVAIADQGTTISMRGMNRILSIGKDTVTVQAGALYIDVAKELEKHKLQFHVNLEIGNITVGVAACCGTKDSSFPGEYGQISSYVIGMKLVKPNGDLAEVTENDPELLRVMRASNGLLGIVYEVTFRVAPLKAMHIDYDYYTLEEFERELPNIQARPESMFMYITPFIGRITVERRKYIEGSVPAPENWRWRVRNYFWKNVAPYVGYWSSRYMAWTWFRHFMQNSLNRFQTGVMDRLIFGRTSPTDQMIRFDESGGRRKYGFSIWAFPEEKFPKLMREYFEFNIEYYKRTGYRCDMLNVGYRISQDDSNFFSYSHDGPVMTVDPVSSGNDGWYEYLAAYNEWCIQHGGKPLFSQSRFLTPRQARMAFGSRIDEFNKIRRQWDPENRLLNQFYAGVFEGTAAAPES